MSMEKYYEKQKLDVPPGFVAGTLARDMNQGPVLSKGEPPNLLAAAMRQGSSSKKAFDPTTKLRRLMNQ
jgi:hypothetical protein